MPTLDDIFTKIQTGKAVRIALPVKGSVERQRISCVYQETEPPELLLLFIPGTLPVDRIDMERDAAVLLDIAGRNITLSADIEKIIGEQTLRLKAKEVISHKQLRDYFRVDVSAPLVARPVLPEATDSDKGQRILNGETIDVSGGGVLAVFPKPVEEDRPLLVELVLPTGTAKTVQAIAHVARSKKISDDQYQVGLHFDRIDSEDRDKIMACCFEIQRKHLRLKVQVKNPESAMR